MVETKSVKVDNWGVFFLQKLQNFFNKTDYCDLTLQFLDNSQLKVHRLVLSACTDYFNVLEQNSDMTDDLLVMPYDLQADVVVPIVNFMYTGTLEFEVNMYARLLKTAKDMNMTVLLKLLEAHKRTVEVAAPVRNAPVLLNKGAQRVTAAATHGRGRPIQPPQQQQRRNMTNRPVVVHQRPQQPVTYHQRQGGGATLRGPSRYEASDENEDNDSSFDNIGYDSRPLSTAPRGKPNEGGGSFEQLRKGYTGVKRPASSLRVGSESPPEKKPNIEDVKEYTEAAKLRNKIAEEFGEDDDSGGEQTLSNETTLIGAKSGENVDHAKIVSEVLKKYPHLLKNNKNIKLKITQKGQQTITAPIRAGQLATTSTTAPSSSSTPKPLSASHVKTSTPNLKVSAQQQPSVASVKRAQSPKPVINVSEQTLASAAPKKIDSRTMHALIAKGAENTTGPWLCLKCGVNGRPISIPSYKGFRRHLINVHKLKIDPSLCEHCGWRSTKKEELHHHTLVIHNLNPPPGMKFPRCEHCNFVAIDRDHLKTHVEEKHPTRAHVQHCIYCNKTFSDESRLYEHMRDNHRDRAREDGVMDTDSEDLGDDDEYVPPTIANKSSAGGTAKAKSKIEVLSNIQLPSKGISSYLLDSSNSHSVSSIGGASTVVAPAALKLEPSSEAEGLSNVASGIAASLGVADEHLEEEAASSQDESNLSGCGYLEDEMALVHGERSEATDTSVKSENATQFVTEEGAHIDLSEEQRNELMQQLHGQTGVVMIMNEEGISQMDHTEDQAEESAAEGVSIEEDNNEEQPQDKSIESDSKENEELNTTSATGSSPNDLKPKTSAAETKKLIEGDWSDDEDGLNETPESRKLDETTRTTDGQEDVVASPDMIVAQRPSRSYKRNSKDSSPKETTPTQDSGIEEKSQISHEAVESSNEIKEEPETIKDEPDDSESKPEVKDESRNETPDINEPKTDEEELKKASKIEIKSLINDWGDDDEDEEV